MITAGAATVRLAAVIAGMIAVTIGEMTAEATDVVTAETTAGMTDAITTSGHGDNINGAASAAPICMILRSLRHGQRPVFHTAKGRLGCRKLYLELDIQMKLK